MVKERHELEVGSCNVRYSERQKVQCCFGPLDPFDASHARAGRMCATTRGVKAMIHSAILEIISPTLWNREYFSPAQSGTVLYSSPETDADINTISESRTGVYLQILTVCPRCRFESD